MASPDPARLSLNTATIREQWGLAQAIDGCARHGIRGIAPWRDQLAAMGVKEAARAINAHGLTVTGLCRGGFFTAKDWQDDNRRAIEEAHALGAQCLVLVVGGLPAGSKDLEGARNEVNDGIAPVTRNAAKADIDGFELELSAVPGEGWLVHAGIGYLNAEYTELDPSENFTTDLLSLLEDNKLVNTPEWTINTGLQYAANLSSGQIITRVNYSYTDDTYKDALNFPQLHQDAFGLLDAFITYVSDKGNWEASLFGKNLTDETYILSGFANGLTQGRVSANLGRPREWGVSFKYLFGE